MSIDVGKILDIIKDPDLKIKINDLYRENIELKEENYNLKKRIDKFEDIADIKSRLIHENNHYFVKSGDDKDGPFCTKCWDSDSKLVRLHKGEEFNGQEHYSCPNCNTPTTIGTYVSSDKFGGTDWGI